MDFNLSNDSFQYDPGTDPTSISAFLQCSQLKTPEQIRRFELLRLGFFVLKLRKFECRRERVDRQDYEYEFRCNLLRHAIFQQVLTLTALDAREQAIRLINACRKKGRNDCDD